MAIGTPTSLGTAFSSDATPNQTIGGITAAVGDLLIVVAGNDGGGAPTGVTAPGTGNTFQRDAFVHDADDFSGSVFSMVVATALSSATLTVAHGTSGTWDRFIAVTKITGSWDSSRVDKTSTGTAATGASWDSGLTATTTVANELVFGLGVQGLGGNATAVASTPGTDLTELHDVDTGSWIHYTTVYRIVSSTGTYKANGTWTGLTNRAWGAIVVTYKEAAGGGGGQTVNPTGLGSAGAFGTPSILVGGVTRTMTGLASAGAFGSPTIAPGGISRTMTGLGSAGAFGAVTATAGGVLVTVSGLGSAGSFGSPTPVPGGTVVLVPGLDSAGQIGTPSTGAGAVVEVSGLGSAAAFGTPGTAVGGVTVPVTGLASAAQFGSPGIEGGIGPTFNPAIHGGKHHR